MATSSRATASRHNTRSCEQCTRITRRRLATRFAPRTGVHNATAGTSCCWKQVQTFTSTPRFHCRVGVRDGILQFYSFFYSENAFPIRPRRPSIPGPRALGELVPGHARTQERSVAELFFFSFTPDRARNRDPIAAALASIARSGPPPPPCARCTRSSCAPPSRTSPRCRPRIPTGPRRRSPRRRRRPPRRTR